MKDFNQTNISTENVAFNRVKKNRISLDSIIDNRWNNLLFYLITGQIKWFKSEQTEPIEPTHGYDKSSMETN